MGQPAGKFRYRTLRRLTRQAPPERLVPSRRGLATVFVAAGLCGALVDFALVHHFLRLGCR